MPWSDAKKQERREAGLCRDCNEHRLPTGMYCQRHLDYHVDSSNRWRRRVYDERKRAGICVWCGEAPAERRRTRCRPCANLNTEAVIASNKRKASRVA